MSFAFGTNAAKTTGGFSLPVTTPTATVAGSVNFSLGGGDASVSKPAPTLTLPTTTTTVAAIAPDTNGLFRHVVTTKTPHRLSNTYKVLCCFNFFATAVIWDTYLTSVEQNCLRPKIMPRRQLGAWTFTCSA
ncbi:unnamed protein product [Timema podura]|uniref:Uncharacterized protein n=1 Tax=Timema podura TaxID=61482 RepID=A0ABN7P041_TIMPD|nr:unnamed protein product [Timema podura]